MIKKTIVMFLIISLTLFFNVDFATENFTRETIIEQVINSSSAYDGIEDNLDILRQNITNLNNLIDYLKMTNFNSKNDADILKYSIDNYGLKGEYQKLLNAKIKIDIQLENAVDDILVNYFYLKDLVNIQPKYMEIQNDIFNLAKLNYDLGKTSKLEFENAAANYDIEKLNYDNLQYNYEMIKMQLREMLNIHYNDDFEVVDIRFENNILNLKSLDYYVSSAVEENIEILNLKIDKDIAEKNLKAYNLYGYEYYNLLKGKLGIFESDYNYNETVKLINSKLNVKYEKILEQYSEIYVENMDYKNELQKFENSKLLYEEGKLDELNYSLLNYKIELKEYQIYNSKRNLNKLIYELENSIYYNN